MKCMDDRYWSSLCKSYIAAFQLSRELNIIQGSIYINFPTFRITLLLIILVPCIIGKL